MFLVVVIDDLNIVRHQVGTSMLHLAERVQAHLATKYGEDHFVEIQRVKVLTGLDKETFKYPVEVIEPDEKELQDWEKELLSINGREIEIIS